MVEPEENRKEETIGGAKDIFNHFSRRSMLKSIGVAGGAISLGGAPFSGLAVGAPGPWAIVALPDTQKYAESSSLISYAHDQVDWVLQEKSRENIAFVTHVGDVVEHGSNRTEWQRMDGVLSKLNGVVPYAVGIGNHDYAVTGDRSSSTANYREYFGKSRYQGRSWFGGAAPNDLGHYQSFSAGGYQFLHLDLEWGIPGTTSDPLTVMGWAQKVLASHKNVPTIVTTHSYLWDKVGYEGHATVGQGANSGRKIFQTLIRSNPQIFMVINGHWHKADGEWAQVSTNSAGSKVFEMLADYQHYANGGNGWLRLIKFVPGGGVSSSDRIRVQTYSPSLDRYQTDNRSQFAFDLNFAERFGSSDGSTEEPPASGTTKSLTIESADGSHVDYAFTVSSSDVTKSRACGASINSNDTVSNAGNGAIGYVTKTGRDSYEFSGSIVSFTADDPAVTYLDCEQVDLTRSSSGDDSGGNTDPPVSEIKSLTIESADGNRVDYSFTVSSSDVTKSRACGASINSGDTISSTGDGATGYVVKTGRDSYEFSGDVVNFTTDGSAITYLDCQQVDLGNSSSGDDSASTSDPPVGETTSLTIESADGSHVDYAFTVSSPDVTKSRACGASINSNDTISSTGDGATGYVTKTGRDSYEFSGSIVSFTADDPAVTYLDCERVDLSDLSSAGTGGTTTETTVTFQNGVGGYTGTTDTYLQEAAPTTNNGTATVLVADREDPSRSGQATQALLGFDEIIGSESNQIPLGSFITAATLQLVTVDDGQGAMLHRMKIPWDDSDTWDSLSNGVQTDGTEAETYADAETSHPVEIGTTSIDVTSSVQAWANGVANHGWVFDPSGKDGWDFYSSEGTTAPALRVTYRSG